MVGPELVKVGAGVFTVKLLPEAVTVDMPVPVPVKEAAVELIV